MNTPHFRRARRLASLLTQYDEKQSAKRGHNIYALGHYMGAVELWEKDPQSTDEPIKTLARYFTTNPADVTDFCLTPVRQFAREITAGKI